MVAVRVSGPGPSAGRFRPPPRARGPGSSMSSTLEPDHAAGADSALWPLLAAVRRRWWLVVVVVVVAFTVLDKPATTTTFMLDAGSHPAATVYSIAQTVYLGVALGATGFICVLRLREARTTTDLVGLWSWSSAGCSGSSAWSWSS